MSNPSCEKMRPLTEDLFSCQQTSTRCNGCRSAISVPKTETILSERQKAERQAYLDEMKEAIRKNRAALVLGAGVSIPSGMPNWNQLISQMMGYAIQYDLVGKSRRGKIQLNPDTEPWKELLAQAGKLVDKKMSLLGHVNVLEAAEYVAQLFWEDAENISHNQTIDSIAVETMVRRIIDQSLTPEECVKKEKIADSLEDLHRKKLHNQDIAGRNTMFAVSYLLSAPNGIHKAMTYNYDPLVQEHMMKLYNMDKNDILTHPGKLGQMTPVDYNIREIYHVHGFVAGTRHSKENIKHVFPNHTGPLILSEDSYYRIEREEAYNWSSSVQSNFLNRYSCIFTGFSADDYNFRRILRQMGRDKDTAGKGTYHYLILTIDDWVKDIYEDACCSYLKENALLDKSTKDAIERDTILLMQSVLRCRDDYWRVRYGICPVWVTVPEIPELLVSLLPEETV